MTALKSQLGTSLSTSRHWILQGERISCETKKYLKYALHSHQDRNSINFPFVWARRCDLWAVCTSGLRTRDMISNLRVRIKPEMAIKSIYYHSMAASTPLLPVIDSPRSLQFVRKYLKKRKPQCGILNRVAYAFSLLNPISISIPTKSASADMIIRRRNQNIGMVNAR